jgi:hypothetical protein
MTGHDNGVITVALTETNDIERERRRLQMNEPYRTLLGHFRHEVGHHFWNIPARDQEGGLAARIDFDPYAVQSLDRISRAWLPFVFAMNSVNRAMGLRDLYPFVLSPAVLIKLEFIHRLIQDRAWKAQNSGLSHGQIAVRKQSRSPETS